MISPEIKKEKVILIHGIYDSGRVFKKMAAFLESHGYKTLIIDLIPNDGSISIKEMAKQLEDFISHKLGQNEEFSLIGFSMGGMVARCFVQNMETGKRLRKLITIASPHRGTIWAYLDGRILAHELRPKSKFLKDLSENRSQKNSMLTIGTPLDLMIVPSWNTKLADVKHQWVWAIAHPTILGNKKCWKAILDFLNVN